MDNQKELDKKIVYLVSQAKDRRTALKVKHQIEDIAKAAGLAVPSLKEHNQIAGETRAEKEAQNLDVQIDEKRSSSWTRISALQRRWGQS